MNQQDFPASIEGFVVTHMLIVEDVDRSLDFYVGSLGASEIVRIPDGRPDRRSVRSGPCHGHGSDRDWAGHRSGTDLRAEGACR